MSDNRHQYQTIQKALKTCYPRLYNALAAAVLTTSE